MGKNNGKNTDAARATALVAGTNAQFTKGAKLAFASGTFTPAQVVTQLQLLISLRKDVSDARAALAAKLAAEGAQLPALKAFMNEFVAFVKVTFSQSPDVLAVFGITPKKAKAPTVQVLAAANAKRAATLAARGTTGTQKRKAIKGAVTGVTVTPIVAGPPVVTGSPAAPSTPASSSGGGATGGGVTHTA